jgi:hypothetical protein
MSDTFRPGPRRDEPEVKLEKASRTLVRDMGNVKSKFLAEWNLLETRSFAPRSGSNTSEMP